MKDFKHLKINKDGGIVHVLMNRGDGRNALSYELMKELTECANQIKSNIDAFALPVLNEDNSFVKTSKVLLIF